MATLRKMLGDINSEECIALMHLIETQSKRTLERWTIYYAREHYASIFQSIGSSEERLLEILQHCEQYVEGTITLKEVKPELKEAAQIARDCKDPILQATARSIATACSVIQTPTNALGFLFYGAAAKAYHALGLEASRDVYDHYAKEQLQHAYDALSKMAVEKESNPVHIKWNC